MWLWKVWYNGKKKKKEKKKERIFTCIFDKESMKKKT